MITYEYLAILLPITIDQTTDMLKQYGDTGWRMVTMYNGYAFFERKIKTEIE